MLVLLKYFLIEAYSSFWRTLLYHYAMLTAASCSASGLCMVFWGLTLHAYIYIYICSLVSVQGYKLPYMHICSLYMHTLSLINIYISYIYMFPNFFYLFAYLLNVAYVQIGANECKCMLHCILQCISCSSNYHRPPPGEITSSSA